MEHKNTILLGLAAMGGIMAIAWTKKPPKEAEITGLWHSPDGINWEGLGGAVLDAGPVTFGASYKNRSSVPLNTELEFSVDEQVRAERERIEPNEEIMSAFPITIGDGSFIATAILLEVETMMELDRKSATFTAVSPLPEPIGHIIAFMVQTEAGWENIQGMELDLDQTILVGVQWANDLPANSIRGHADLTVTRPDGSRTTPTATSGQNKIIAGGATDFVTFRVQLNQEGSWRLDGVLSGETVA